MKRFGILMMLLALAGVLRAQEMETWRAIGGFKTQAAFVEYKDGKVTLKKENGKEITVRLEKLLPRYRMKVIQMAGDHAHGSIPAGQITVPTGRRELTWDPILRGGTWPAIMSDSERDALEGLDRGWKQAETRFFIVHYQQVGFAKRVARMADYMYLYIAADLPGFKDRSTEKSHIVVVRKPEEWKEFLQNANSVPGWSAAYVRGNIMFLYDIGDNEQNASILAHEMSHLVLNRFFSRPPPLWLNEGLAEWYGNFGWKAFKGQLVDVEDGLGEMRDPYRLRDLTEMRGYPNTTDQVSRYYATSQQIVGMLKLRKDQRAFVKFLQAITVNGEKFNIPLRDVYGIADINEFQAAFDEFLD